MATHEPNWAEDRGKSTDKQIAFRCTGDKGRCGKIQTLSRKVYETGMAFPSLAAHS